MNSCSKKSFFFQSAYCVFWCCRSNIRPQKNSTLHRGLMEVIHQASAKTKRPKVPQEVPSALSLHVASVLHLQSNLWAPAYATIFTSSLRMEVVLRSFLVLLRVIITSFVMFTFKMRWIFQHQSTKWSTSSLYSAFCLNLTAWQCLLCLFFSHFVFPKH